MYSNEGTKRWVNVSQLYTEVYLKGSLETFFNRSSEVFVRYPSGDQREVENGVIEGTAELSSYLTEECGRLIQILVLINYLHSGLHIVNNMRSRQRNIHNTTTWWYITYINFKMHLIQEIRTSVCDC